MAESELALINKVELRIALAENDKQFENALNLYLAPLLLKLSSPHAEVRQAVLKIIQYLIPRISAARTIKLPVSALLEQVKNPKVPAGEGPPLVRLYSLLLISRSIDRMTIEEKKLLVPKVIENISTYPTNVSSRLFSVLCKLLDGWKVPERESQEYNRMNRFLLLDKNPEDEKFISFWISKFLLLQPNSTASPLQFPGLSTKDTTFLTQDAGITYKTPQEIFEVKTRLLEFLKAGFQPENLAIPLLIASCDSSSAISDPSSISFKKLNTIVEDPSYIDSLISLFIGSPETFTPPARTVLQEKILSVLLKSKTAAQHSQVTQIASLSLASDYYKLKQTGVQFIKWVSKNNDTSAEIKGTVEFNTDMAAQLKSNLLGEGWPKMDMSGVRNYSSSMNQRSLQYEALGNILKSSPNLIIEDFAYLEFLFQSLEGEESDLRSTIQEALSGLTVYLPSLSISSRNELKTLAKKYLSSDKLESKENLQSCRFVVVKYVNCTFPFSDSYARYLCILGTSSDNRPDTIEEAIKGLHPHWFNILQSSNTVEFKATSDLLGNNSRVKFPSFSDIVFTLKDELANVKEDEGNKIYKSMGRAIQFILQTLVMQSIDGKSTVIIPDEEWLIRLEKAIEVDKTIHDCLINEIKVVSQEDTVMEDTTEYHENSFNLFLSIIFDCFVNQDTDYSKIPSNITFGTTFTKLISLSPPKVIENLIPCIPKLMELLNHKLLNDTSNVQVAQSIGIIASHPKNNEISIRELFDKLIPERTNYSFKSKLLSSAFLFSRLAFRQRIDSIDPKLLTLYCQKLVDALKDSSTYAVALECVSQLSIFGLFGPILQLSSEIRDYVNVFINEIKGNVKKCDEKSILTLAYLVLTLDNQPHNDDLTDYEKMVYETHISKQIEFVFTSGEALSILSSGWQSKVLQRHLDIQGESIKYIPLNVSRLMPILKTVLQSCTNTKPSLRKAGCIWLLSMVQYCGELEEIRNHAPDIHLVFMRFLADRDELVQESASRGLSLVYEMGDYELKDTLVRGLLKSFTDSNSSTALSSGSVGHETELFEPELLKTNDGSVSTYKDVLNLASDVGDPSLVYKFMSLAKSSALWSSRKGMAFGLGSILSKSSLDEMLSSNKTLANRLIPKLFRYRYDPNTSVSKSMDDIWNALVKDTSKTINTNFVMIQNELLKGMGNKEWRVRQASTAALNDLLQAVSLETYEDKIEQIWVMSFRAMDDIKESVRKEGTSLTRSLATTLTRTADVKAGASTNKATEVLSSLIPFLLGNKGLLSDAEDIKTFALETILKLCKVGGSAIRPFIPELLDNFIGLMSSLEPEAVNYLVLNADKYNLKSNDIDAKRLQSLGHSPMMDAIEKLLDSLDDGLMPKTIRVLQQSIKKHVGLPSKVCGSRVLVSLVSKHLELTKPYGDQLLKICTNQINDRNDTVATSYAAAAGYVCRISSIDSIVAYSQALQNLYFESEDNRSREISSIGSESISKYSGDKFELVLSAFLPLAFIGKHDEIKSVKQPFEREWIENTSGNNSIKLYIREICDVCDKYLNSNQYGIRKTIGRSIVALCNSIDETKSFPQNLILELFNILIESCKGKSWSGKELILESLISISIKSKEMLQKNEELYDRVNKVVITEAKRRNKEYQKYSINLMGKYIRQFPVSELVEVYIEIMSHVVSDEYYDDDSDDEMEDNKSKAFMIQKEDERLSFIRNLYDAVAVPIDNELCKLVLQSSINLFKSNIDITWRSKIQINENISGFVKLLINENQTMNNDLTGLLFDNWKLLNQLCLSLKNIENVKIQFIRFSNSAIVYFEKINEVKYSQIMRNALDEFKTIEPSTIIQSELLQISN